MSLRRAFLTYTLGRFGLFLLSAIILYSAAGLLGNDVNGLTLLLFSLIASALLSAFFLRPQRERFSQAVTESRERRAAALAEQRARLGETP
jgi:peptidoglycan/LPS O-acetylase OafA/YrhL